MPCNDALYDGESDAGPGKVFGRMQTLKDTKQLLRVAHVESGAVVLDLINRFLVLDPTADPEVRLGALCAVLQCVADEIGPDLAHDGGVALDSGQIADLDQRFRARIERPRLGCRGMGQLSHVDQITMQVGAPDT